MTLCLLTPGLLLQCHEDEHATEADDFGVAAPCEVDDDCINERNDDSDFVLTCLTNFKGGYCGIRDCTEHADCPEGSACVEHSDGMAYCFRVCVDKSECNANRDVDNEANCSANIDWLGDDVGKACVPPSG